MENITQNTNKILDYFLLGDEDRVLVVPSNGGEHLEISIRGDNDDMVVINIKKHNVTATYIDKNNKKHDAKDCAQKFQTMLDYRVKKIEKEAVQSKNFSIYLMNINGKVGDIRNNAFLNTLTPSEMRQVGGRWQMIQSGAVDITPATTEIGTAGLKGKSAVDAMVREEAKRTVPLYTPAQNPLTSSNVGQRDGVTFRSVTGKTKSPSGTANTVGKTTGKTAVPQPKGTVSQRIKGIGKSIATGTKKVAKTAGKLAAEEVGYEVGAEAVTSLNNVLSPEKTIANEVMDKPVQPTQVTSTTAPVENQPSVKSEGGTFRSDVNWPLVALLAVGAYAGFELLDRVGALKYIKDVLKNTASKIGEIIFTPFEKLANWIKGKDEDEVDEKDSRKKKDKTKSFSVDTKAVFVYNFAKNKMRQRFVNKFIENNP